MKANAWHHRADAVSSLVALVGVGNESCISLSQILRKSFFILHEDLKPFRSHLMLAYPSLVGSIVYI